MPQTEQATYELAGIDGMTLEQIQSELESGGRFVIFKSRISLLFIGFDSISNAILIRSTEDIRSKAWRYSLSTLLLGWWSLSGPVNSIQALRFNLSGGVDVTDDIRANLSQDAVESGVVIFERIATVFSHVGRHNFKAIAGAVAPVLKNYSDVRAGYTGLFVDTPPGVKPYFVIGVDTDDLSETLREEILTALIKPYHRNVPFTIIGPQEERWEQLVAQGEVVYQEGIGAVIQ